MARGMMRDDGDHGHHHGEGSAPRGDDDTASVLGAAQEELARAADDLERVTTELRNRTLRVERLELLADALLDLVPVPAVMVDPDGRVAAVSRRAAAAVPSLADGLGKPASRVVPKALLAEITAFSAGEGTTPQDGDRTEGSTRLVALPDGSTLAVFEP